MKFSSEYLSIYPWHSINLIPTASCVACYTDDDRPIHDSSMIEVVVLGQIVHINLPFKLPSVGTALIGPLWSRKRKVWYSVPKYK
jgi:hypothetical protein